MRARAIILGSATWLLAVGCGLTAIGSPGDGPTTDAPASIDGSTVDVRGGDGDGSAGGDITIADASAEDADSSPPPPAPPSVGATTVANDSLTVDRTRKLDGAIATDGESDGAFDVTITGPAIAMALVRTDSAGDPTALQEWDTWTGTDAIPAGVGAGFAFGGSTWQLAVYDGPTLLNDAAGRVSIPAGAHSLRVFGSNAGSFVSGSYFRIAIETVDHTIVWGPTVAY